MFVHSVYFWLQEGTDREAFAQDLATLGDISTVKGYHMGTPVPSERPVVVGDYDYGITVIFDDKAGHDTYQDDPLHHAFLANNKPKFAKIQVYDFE